MKYFPLLLLMGSLILACQPEKNKNLEIPDRIQTPAANDPGQESKEDPGVKQQDPEFYVPQSTDEQTAKNLKSFLKNYVGDEYAYLQDLDKKFQFYKKDLNDDGSDEIFVRLMGPYFCGSGGCTFLLLDNYGELITKFTVTRAPIFIEPSKVNGWSLLLVRDSGVFKELIFENGSYPSNPSLLPKAPYDAPSGHAELMFDEDLYRSKTFEY
jgi:hypothetical protein